MKYTEIKLILGGVLLSISDVGAQVLSFADDTPVFYNGNISSGVEFNGTEVTVSREAGGVRQHYKNIDLPLDEAYLITPDTVVAFEIREEGRQSSASCFAVESREASAVWASPYPSCLGIGRNSRINNRERSLEPSPTGTNSWVFANYYSQYGVEEHELGNGWIRYSVNVSQLLANRSASFSVPDSISAFHLGFVGGDTTTKVTYRNFRIYEENSARADFGTLAAHEDLWVDGNIYLAGELLGQDGLPIFDKLLSKARLEPQGDISMGIFGSE